MIDDGETDWKILAIRTSNPLAAKLHCKYQILHFRSHARNKQKPLQFRTFHNKQKKYKSRVYTLCLWIDHEVVFVQKVTDFLVLLFMSSLGVADVRRELPVRSHNF